MLMLRQKRAMMAPAWLLRLLEQDEEAESPGSSPSGSRPDASPTRKPPTSVSLSHEQFEAAAVIQRRASVAAGHAPGRRRSVSGLGRGASAEGVLNHELLHTVVDLLPSALHVESCVLNGYGPLFGVFLAEELAKGLREPHA